MTTGPQKEKKTGNGGMLNKTVLIRCGAIMLVFLAAVGLLSAKLFELQVTQASVWQARANGQQLKSTEIEPRRGNIYDSEMRVLAESATVWTVEAYPNVLAASKLKEDVTTETDPARLASKELARILDLDEEELYANLGDKEKKYYMVKAKIEKPLADEIVELKAATGLNRGITLTEDTKRYYPYDDLAASVLGFTDSDGSGIEGLESQYNDTLSGVAGRLITARTANGGEMPADEESVKYDSEDGQSIVLTVNADIQQSLEKHLTTAVNRYQAAERGMGIVFDVNTGAILAMATKPDFNPNEPYFIWDDATRAAIEAMPTGTEEEQNAKTQAQGAARIRQWRNKAVADTYEPGSVFKVITAAAALDSGMATPETGYYCSGSIQVADRTMGCASGAVHQHLSLSQALIESCNVSFIQIGQQLGASTWYDYVNAFGLTEPTGVDLPGEPSQKSINQLVYSEAALGPVQLASCSFGQSNKYTALQMVTAVSAAVNGGNLVQPHIVDRIVDSEGNVVETYEQVVKRQVVSAETSSQLNVIMEDLVSGTGLGKNAYVAGYHVGGKSGTSQKLEKETETEKYYISSFLGFAPANDPQIAVLIVLDEPIDPNPIPTFFGGRLAGPTVGSVISDTVKILGIEPDFSDDEEGLARVQVACPKLVGLHNENAYVALNTAGLNYKTMGSGDMVLAQYPEQGSQIPRGGQVILYTDPEDLQRTVTMPSLVGKTAKQALADLKSLGLNVLTDGAPESGAGVEVMEQDIPPDTEVPLGSVVNLILLDTTAVTDH